MDIPSTQQRLLNAKHLATAFGWTCLFLFSVYVLANAIMSSKPYTVLHLLAPPILLLVSIRASLRYLRIRGQKRD